MWQMSSVFSHESAQRNDAGHLICENVFKTKRTLIDESVDVTSPHYWFAIQKAFVFFLLTTIHRFKVYFTVFCSIAWQVETRNHW